MENLTQGWTQSWSFFQNQSTFFDVEKRSGDILLPPSPSCAPAIWILLTWCVFKVWIWISSAATFYPFTFMQATQHDVFDLHPNDAVSFGQNFWKFQVSSVLEKVPSKNCSNCSSKRLGPLYANQMDVLYMFISPIVKHFRFLKRLAYANLKLFLKNLLCQLKYRSHTNWPPFIILVSVLCY